MWHLLVDILRNSILITGLVVVMMMMIESLNIESKGLFFKGLRKKINKERGILIGITLVMLVSIFAALIFPKITTYPGKVREIGRYVKIDNGKHVIVDDRMQTSDYELVNRGYLDILDLINN